MCTLALAHRVWSEAPLLVAANRDEQLDRPASPPELVAGDPAYVAPTDLRGGGTWLGLNANALFVGVTNRFGAEPDDTRRSRGLLVRDLLTERDASSAAERAADSAATGYNPFHLFVVDLERAYRIHSDGQRLHRELLEPGLHLLTERSLGAGPSAREVSLGRILDTMATAGAPDDATLCQLLASHAEPSFEGMCVHMPQLNYGTRSSTVLRLGRHPHQARLLHADGPPCQTAYADRSDLVQTLLR